MTMNENNEFDFIKEKIKEKPVNKKKLLRRTIITASMAVVFGLVACITFLVLEPVFSNWLYPEEEPDVITLPATEDEIMPEDMLLEEPDTEKTDYENALEEEETIEESLVDRYIQTYDKLREVSTRLSNSLVTVSSVVSDVDWFNNNYENEGRDTGFLIGNNGKEFIFIVSSHIVKNADSIGVTFSDGTKAKATLKKENTNIGLSSIGVELKGLPEELVNQMTPIVLGGSNLPSLLGSPIIAIGSPMGYSDSVAYGFITSLGNPLQLVDSNYKLMTTDIYGSQNASGVLVNVRGQVVGIICQKYNTSDMKNMVSAIGITELRSSFEKLLKEQELAYLGIKGIDVTYEANQELGVPMGAFVSEVKLDSPAMQIGIQSGDVITKLNDHFIDTFADYVTVLHKLKPGEDVTITLMRQSREVYQQIKVKTTLGSLAQG